VVVTIRDGGVVCMIMGEDSDGTLEQEEWFEGGRRIVYKESAVGVGGFPFLLSLLVLLNSKASHDFETASTHVLSGFPRNEPRASCPAFDTLLLPIPPTPDSARYITYEANIGLEADRVQAIGAKHSVRSKMKLAAERR
jgi:hypothetical protein